MKRKKSKRARARAAQRKSKPFDWDGFYGIYDVATSHSVPYMRVSSSSSAGTVVSSASLGWKVSLPLVMESTPRSRDQEGE